MPPCSDRSPTQSPASNSAADCCSAAAQGDILPAVPAHQPAPAAGCGCSDDAATTADSTWLQELRPIAVATGLFVVGLVWHEPLHNTPGAIAEYAVLLPAYLLSGWTVLTTAGRNILRGRIFDENFLMTIATLGAIAIHELPEAVAVMVFFQIGELFQHQAVGRSRRSIKALLEVRPDTARLKRGDEVHDVPPETVQIGDQIAVYPGDQVPLDGKILTGQSWVDTSALTGESVPRSLQVGDSILAGMINQSGILTVQVTQDFGQSAIAKVLDLVENASRQKAKTEKFITQFARYYTPVVVALSLGVAVIPPLLLSGATSAEWVYRALVLLVISCPCGLVISIPLGYFGGVGRAARQGILVKGSTFLDALTQVSTVVFDKTGTLTHGNFQVTAVNPHNGWSADQLLEMAAQVEAASPHPIALSIRQAYGQTLDANGVDDYEELSGHGIRATVQGRQVLAGNDRLLHREGIPHETCDVGGTVAHVAIDGTYSGHILIADEVKPEAREAVQALHNQDIRTVMLTGDSVTVAAQVAATVGLDTYQAELLPDGKVAALEALLHQAHQQGRTVVFVGDGINDAPAIARADVGMAMGGLGSDAAIATADVVIMADSPAKVATAIQIARRTRRIVWQNIALALTVKVVVIALGTVGIANLWTAVFADVGVALLAIVNASRV